MNFWNDFEGKTLDEKYPLEKLLYPEGRSGFFTTSNGTGAPAVVRLTESLNDEKDAFEQWEIVRRLDHPNLITIKSYGQTTLDDTPLLFAVLEPSDASLADILKERSMTATETRDIALSVLSALKELHASGLIHGHVEPASVLAVGEVVKLRSDCVRKLPHGYDGERLKALEVQDFATLLLEALTQQRRQRNPTLPAPFDRIVSNGTAGTWGVKEIAEALQSDPPALATQTLAPRKALPKAFKDAPDSEDAPGEIVPIESPTASVIDRALPPTRAAVSLGESGEPWPRRYTPAVALGAVSLLLILCIFYFLHRASAKHPAAVAATPPPLSNPQPVSSPAPVPTQIPAASPSLTAPANEVTPPSGRKIWRVVAYTYHTQQQAQQKVSSIEKHHSSLTPEVFSPNGHAPYLVTLGGAMSHDEAISLRRKAQAEGFPRDTYTQNYAN